MKKREKIISLAMTLVFLISCLSLPAAVSAAEPFSETLFTETFSKDSVSAGTGIGSYNRWIEDSASGTSISENTIKAETTENMVGSILLKGSSESSIGTQRLRRSFDSQISSQSDIMELGFRIKRLQDNANTLMMTLQNAGAENTNIIMYIELATDRIRTDKMNSETVNGYIKPAGISGIEKWYNLKFVINSEFETEVYVDDTKVRTWESQTSGITAFPQGVYFSTTAANWGGQKDTTKDAEFQIDDISVIAYNNEYAVPQALELLAADDSVVTTATDLELPTVLNGVAVTWTVVSGTCINANGVITKGDAEQTATLKATVGEGEAAQSRNYTVKVLPSNVALYEDFSSVLNNADLSIGGFNGWTDAHGNGYENKSKYNSVNTIKLVDGNPAASIFRNGVEAESVPTDGLATRKFYKSFALTNSTQAEISLRVKYGENAGELQFTLNGGSSASDKIIYLDFRNNRIKDNAGSAKITNIGYNAPNTWYDIKFNINSSDYLTTIYVNGNPVGTLTSAESGITQMPTKITFNTTRGANGGQKDITLDAEYLVDDILIKALTADEIACNTVSAALAITGDKSADFTLPAASEEGVNISWVSSNTDIIKIEGNTAKVTRPENSSINEGNDRRYFPKVDLTATITKGNAEVKKTITVSVEPVYKSYFNGIGVEDGKITGLGLINCYTFNPNEQNVTANLYLAVYGSGNILKGIVKANNPAVYGYQGFQSATFDKEKQLSVSDGDRVKAFLWETGTLKPLSIAYDEVYTTQSQE